MEEEERPPLLSLLLINESKKLDYENVHIRSHWQPEGGRDIGQ
jgi:hypothetical protein